MNQPFGIEFIVFSLALGFAVAFYTVRSYITIKELESERRSRDIKTPADLIDWYIKIDAIKDINEQMNQKALWRESVLEYGYSSKMNSKFGCKITNISDYQNQPYRQKRT